MILDPDVFRVNGVPYAWQSVALFLDGMPRRRFTAISFEEKLERAQVYAANRSGQPLGMTAGKYSVSGLTVTVLPDEEEWIRSYLFTKSGLMGAGKPFFTLQLQLIEDDHTITTDFADCKYAGAKQDAAEGTEGLVKVCSVDCLSMTVGGVPLYDQGRALL